MSNKQTVKNFIKSEEFKAGVFSATKAGWSGSGYSVEIFPEGTWRVLWDNNIGNLYESRGVILPLPQLPESAGSNVEEWEESWDYEADDLAEELLNQLEA